MVENKLIKVCNGIEFFKGPVHLVEIITCHLVRTTQKKFSAHGPNLKLAVFWHISNCYRLSDLSCEVWFNIIPSVVGVLLLLGFSPQFFWQFDVIDIREVRRDTMWKTGACWTLPFELSNSNITILTTVLCFEISALDCMSCTI